MRDLETDLKLCENYSKPPSVGMSDEEIMDSAGRWLDAAKEGWPAALRELLALHKVVEQNFVPLRITEGTWMAHSSWGEYKLHPWLVMHKADPVEAFPTFRAAFLRALELSKATEE